MRSLAPASGSTQRNVTATVFDSEDTPIEDNPVTYQLDQEVEGVTLQDQVLTVTSELQKKRYPARDGYGRVSGCC